ncbi:DivIVA domain-containing protein [Nocardia stercoris]|uniref:Cell wall synthesis protein Wag31 n=1 Tax=Nocardia stercoris TaxID=2483361 RepID=A0A3M2KZL7_9NOCA|nr:DivIVA domain-containing protein [Nocardia stercoris]RMI30594.1 DivIVA domain-containing protein [Nocardia stercoris]
MTPEDVRNVRFPKAPFGHRGYDIAEVDAFCETLAQAFSGRGALTTAHIRQHAFSATAFGHRGYHRDDVDEFLDRACVDLESARRGESRRRTGGRILTPEDIRRLRFSPPPQDRPGYPADEVDVFLGRVAATLAHTGPGGLTSSEVRTIGFCTAPAGRAAYHRDEVDAFVDVVVRTLQTEERAVREHARS